METNYIDKIASKLNLNKNQVRNVLDSINLDNTVHFIARYRKEKTGNLNEILIRDIIDLNNKYLAINKLKQTALVAIREQDKLTLELEKQIIMAETLAEVEDLYAPYKRKKKTKADVAREKGFEIISKQIKYEYSIDIPPRLLNDYSKEEILEGAKDILSQYIADDSKLKSFVRKYYSRFGVLSVKSKDPEKFDEKQKKESYKFKIYDSFSLKVTNFKSYQILALNRGETLGILTVGLAKDEVFFEKFQSRLVKKQNIDLIDCVKEGYKKIFKSIERELRTTLTQSASIQAIKVFKDNLKNLLMLKPHYSKNILAIDPGFRTGCKLCVLDKDGMTILFDKIFLHKKELALTTLTPLLEKVDSVVIGNGTASNETYELIDKNFSKEIIVVNESGASVYSTSKIGQEEFPKLDATDRGTISIGRRYIDSLSELVKVPVISIGVGMYQHDLNQKELEQELSNVVEDVVNLVGINVNSASIYLLSYVSGLTKKSAKKIFDNRPYNSREELKKILSKKVYEQSVGFLRVIDGLSKFDNTGIHPEQYELAELIVSKINEPDVFNKYKTELFKIKNDITSEVVQDIINDYKNAGTELRQYEGNLKVNIKIKFEDLKIGDILTGVVRNVTQFGAFVDVGLKNDALIHISQLANMFVKNPSDIISIGQEVKAKLIDIDQENKRLKLSLKDVNK